LQDKKNATTDRSLERKSLNHPFTEELVEMIFYFYFYFYFLMDNMDKLH